MRPCQVNARIDLLAGNKPSFSTSQWGYTTYYTGWQYIDGSGTVHPFSFQSTVSTGCTSKQTSGSGAATDGSGYSMTVMGDTVTSLHASTGALINPSTGATNITDRNGNEITSTNSSGTTTYYDTLNTPVLTVAGSGTPSSPITFTYALPSGGTAKVTMNYTQYTVATYFHISGISEYGATSVPLVSSIVLADGVSTYTFQYEKTPSGANCTPISGTYAANCVTARLASITLPTGGQIIYAYTGGPTGAYGIWRRVADSIKRFNVMGGGPDDKREIDFGCPTRRFYVWGF